MEFVQPLRLRNTEGAWRVIVNGIHVYRSGNVHSVNRCHHAIIIRVSQKIQKSEFWNVTYPSGFHRLDEPPKKIQHYRPINDIVQAIFSFTL